MPKRNGHRRALQALVSRPWAIMRDYYETMFAIAAEDPGLLAAIAKETGETLENVQHTTVRDGVATIEITGPLFKHADLLSAISGATTYERLARDANRLMEDPSVGAVVAEFDTPGGDVNGLLETADLLAEFAAADTKPFIAHVGGLGASAGYVLASAFQEIVATDLSILGSLGVVKSIVDFRKRDAMEGIEEIEIISSQSPLKRPDAKTKTGHEQHQREVNSIAAVVIARVARYRGVSEETVLADYGQGDVFIGQQAVDAGMAERVRTLEELHAELVEQISSRNSISVPGSAAATTKDSSIMSDTTKDTTAAQTPEQRAAAFEATDAEAANVLIAKGRTAGETAGEQKGREVGATTERKRLLAIEQLTEPGYEALITACKEDPLCTPEAAALKMKQQERAAKTDHLQSLEQDETQNKFPNPSAGESESATEEEQLAARILNAGRPPQPASAPSVNSADKETNAL